MSINIATFKKFCHGGYDDDTSPRMEVLGSQLRS